MAKQVILRLEGEDVVSKIIETDLSSTEIQEAVDKIQAELMYSEDGWNEEKILDELEKRGYLEVIEDSKFEFYDIVAF